MGMDSESSIIRPLLGHSLAGAVLGLPFGYPALGALVGSGVFVWRFSRQLNQLLDWSQHSIEEVPPDLAGPLGDLSYRLSRQQRVQAAKQRRLQAVIRRFQQSASSLSDAIVIIDKHDDVEWWNEAGNQLLGLLESDRGSSILNMIRDPRFVKFYRSAQSTEPLTLPNARDRSSILEYRLHFFGDGDRVLVVRDVTDLHKMEQMRRDFVSNASHELRTPLTVIHGYLETFLDSPLPAPLERPVTQMYQQSKRMANLISDLLMLSKLESGNEARGQDLINIQTMLKQILEEAKALSAERQHQISLTIDTDLKLRGEEREIYSAFSNLAFNAVRYTPEGGEISLSWQETPTGAEFSVRDTGIGIHQSDIPRITERFYRVDSGRSRESGGTGLGLAIVKHVLVRHQGQLKITSRLGSGSTFTCQFPKSRLG